MEKQQHEDRPLGPVEFMNAAVAAILVGLVIAAGGCAVAVIFSLELVPS